MCARRHSDISYVGQGRQLFTGEKGWPTFANFLFISFNDILDCIIDEACQTEKQDFKVMG